MMFDLPQQENCKSDLLEKSNNQSENRMKLCAEFGECRLKVKSSLSSRCKTL